MRRRRYNVIDIAKDIITGQIEYSDQEIQDKRLAICEGCDSRNKILNICKECGCYIPFKIKLSESECPINKW